MHPTVDSTEPGREQELELLDLTCPACDSDLIADELFLSHRVCGVCNRHFSIGARERISLLVDSGLFEELNTSFAPPESTLARDRFPSAERLAEHHHLQVIGEAIVSGIGRIGGDHLVGSALGALMTEKVILALDYARSRKHPVALICTGAASSGHPGPLALVQGGRLATAFSQLHLEGVPVVGVLAHPIAGSVFATLAAHCDLLYAEPGVLVSSGFAAGGGTPNMQRWQPVDTLAARGWIDAIVDRSRIRGHLAAFVDVVGSGGVVRSGSAPVPGAGNALTAAEAIANLDHPARPSSANLVASLVSGFVELRGDRVASENPAVICGIGRLDSLPVAICAQIGEADSIDELAEASAARKIARLARLAGRLELPLVMLVDSGTPSGPAAFSPEAAFAVSSLASIIAQLPVPVIAIGTGRVGGLLSTSLMIGDRQFLMSSAVYVAANITPGGGPVPGSPRQSWTPGRVNPVAGVLTARECEELGLIDGVINEPRPGAHADAEGTLAIVRSVLLASLAELTGTGQRRLLDTRHRRQRTLGQSTPEGLAAAHSELWELQEFQRSVGRSLDEWRDRWDQLKLSQPRLSFQRPDINDLAAKLRARRTELRARRTELLERAGLGDRSSE
ncbi:MAG: hypothetical protein WKF63_08215 [Thermomicrobiales bacterium]